MRALLLLLFPLVIDTHRLKGSHWSDLAHIYSVAAAGFVPEVFGLAFSAPFVQDLLDTHHARVLIYADTFEALLPRVEWHQTAVKLPKLYNLPMTGAQPSAPPDVSADDVAMIFHTSGTTGGRPKPIPQTHKWLVAEGEVTWKCVIQRHPEGQHIFNNIGSFASIGAATCACSGSVRLLGVVTHSTQALLSYPGRAHV